MHDSHDMTQLVNQFKELTPISCIFTKHVELVKLMGWDENANSKDKDGFIYPSNMYCIARVRNQDAMRAIRQKLYQNDDWHTSGITRFFVGWKVQKSKYRLEIQVTEGVTNIPGIGSNGLPE